MTVSICVIVPVRIITRRASAVGPFETGWEGFVRRAVADEPFPWDFSAGARGVRLTEAARLSREEGRRVEMAELDD